MSFNRKFILKSGSFSTLELLSNQGLGLISFMILARVISTSEFGTWALYMAITTLLEQARIGFIKNGFIKYMNSGGPEVKTKVFATSITLNFFSFLVTAAISVILAFFIAPVAWESEILTPMFLWYIPYAFLLTFYLQFKMVEQAHLDFKGSFLTAFFRRIFFIGAIVFYVVVGRDISLMELTYLNVVSILIGFIFSYALARGKMKYELGFDREWAKKLSAFGVFTFGTNMSAMVLRDISQYMLGPTTHLAFYNTAMRITNLIEIPTNAMSSIVYPKSVSMVHDNKTSELKDMYERSVAIIFLFVLPIVITVLIFPEIFIIIIGGYKYLDAVNYLRVTILFALFVPFMRQSGTILDSMGKPKINFYLTIIAAIVNVISNLLFIHFLGPIGAAYATLVSYSVILIVNQVYIRSYLGIEIKNVFKFIGYYYRTSFSMVLKKLKA